MVIEQDLQQIQKALELERDLLLHSRAKQKSSQPELENPDENDLADLYETQEIQSSLDELSSRRLNRILLALDRLKKGTYGVCMKCKTAIPTERLMALPYAELCVACQERLEGKEMRT